MPPWRQVTGLGKWYSGKVVETKSELDGRRVRLLYRVMYEDGSRMWHGDGVGAAGRDDHLMCYEWQRALMTKFTLQFTKLSSPSIEPQLPANSAPLVIATGAAPRDAHAAAAAAATVAATAATAAATHAVDALVAQHTRQLLALRQYIEVRRAAAGKWASKPWKLTLRRTHLTTDVLTAFGQVS